jgi:hypothetical protein
MRKPGQSSAAGAAEVFSARKRLPLAAIFRRASDFCPGIAKTQNPVEGQISVSVSIRHLD